MNVVSFPVKLFSVECVKVMAAAASFLRVSCITTTFVRHQACIRSSYHSSASSLVGRRSVVWTATELCKVHSICKTPLLQRVGRMSSSETPRCFSNEAEAEIALVKKKCTPCSSKELRPMTEESAKSLLEQIPGWDLLEVDGKLQLQRSWKSKNFVKGLEFIKSIADVAESEGHHPDLHLVNWNDVKANIWTHSIGGLTENDFILAAKINTLRGEGLLRKIVTKAAPNPPTSTI